MSVPPPPAGEPPGTPPTASSPLVALAREADAVLLDVEDIWQNLGGHQILEGVTFQIRDRVRPGLVTGQVVGLLGPSGVGKTRMIRLIAGLDRPDRGSIHGHKGEILHPGSVGVVFQNYPLLRHRTVAGNLVMAGVANGMGAEESKTRARHLLDRFGLGHRLGFYPAQISGGQRQRAAIAQQLMRHKSLLLMDEPFSGLDPAALEEVIKLLLEVAHMDEYNTIVVVTHDIRSAMVVSDTLLMLGRDRDAKGEVVSGARIQHTYDLVAEGLAWRPELEHDQRFRALEREVKERFRSL
jgi:polar amino acid transport system ATP-binding protein/sulfate transport system ATP-binding protein